MLIPKDWLQILCLNHIRKIELACFWILKQVKQIVYTLSVIEASAAGCSVRCS